MSNLMEWLRQHIPSSGFPSEAPNGAPVVYNAWDSVSWWFNPLREDASSVVGSLGPSELYKTQPHLRTVVSFVARNTAQLGIHVFERVDDNDRRRDHASPVAQLLKTPNPETTLYELILGSVSDLMLYDRCYWWVVPDAERGFNLIRIPVPWVTTSGQRAFGWDEYLVRFPGAEKSVKVNPDQLLVFNGYSPTSLTDGSTPVDALKDQLLEQIEAVKYRKAVWKRGGKVSSVITRPPGVKWSDAARKQFTESWKSKFAGDGPDVGGTPILEDGMTLNKVDFSAKEQEFIEGTRLSLNTVASVYHVNPTMIGLLDNANYSNVREFRKMLYGDTLGPVIAQFEDRMNSFLLPMLGMDNTRFYVEFNVQEKLQGNFEEQAKVMQTMVGAPIMTRNEGRARFNLPKVEGGDELITPLNVLEGGQASPTDSGSQNVDPGADQPDQAPKELSVPPEFKARQIRTALSRKNAGYEVWWDEARWDRELSKDLGISTAEAHELNENTRKELDG